MNELDFTLELNSDDLPKKIEYDLFTEAETRLKKLAADHTDITGAAINIRQPVSGATSFLYELTVVVYCRPENIAATKKEATAYQALDEALTAVERQVRQQRKKLKNRWEQPGNSPTEQEIMEVVTAERTP